MYDFTNNDNSNSNSAVSYWLFGIFATGHKFVNCNEANLLVLHQTLEVTANIYFLLII